MKIFISYRRQDSTPITGRIYDRLISAFGDRAIFRDIDDIPAGRDFRTVLENAVSQCEVMLVIIGPNWASSSDANGNRRLFDANDFVRIEVESGLKRKNILVIPVLAMGASMPKATDLPDSMQELLFRNAAVVRNDPDFDNDMRRLVRQLRNAQTITERAAKKLPLGIGILFLAALFIYGGYKLLQLVDRNVGPTSTTTGIVTVPVEATSTVNLIRDGIAQRSFSVYKEPNLDSLVIDRANQGDTITIFGSSSDGVWFSIRLADGTEGWGRSDEIRILSSIQVGSGYGVRGEFWEVYFTAPLENPNPESPYGIDARLAAAIDRAKSTIDIALFEIDNEIITDSILQAFENGVVVRMVTDDEFGLEADVEPGRGQFARMQQAGIEVRTDTRTALMHNKFIILDGVTVWTGSWNYTNNSTYTQNNNTLVITDPSAVKAYQSEFNEMFEQNEFGPNSPTSNNKFYIGDSEVEIHFTPEEDPFESILEKIQTAKRSIYFMAFSFTDYLLADEMIKAANRGVSVKGIFEKVGSGSAATEFNTLYCSGQEVLFDGNPQFLHHKIIVIDEEIVITGSMNFSTSAMESNDENLIIIRDRSLASAYKLEFDRLWEDATSPEPGVIDCP